MPTLGDVTSDGGVDGGGKGGGSGGGLHVQLTWHEHMAPTARFVAAGMKVGVKSVRSYVSLSPDQLPHPGGGIGGGAGGGDGGGCGGGLHRWMSVSAEGGLIKTAATQM